MAWRRWWWSNLSRASLSYAERERNYEGEEGQRRGIDGVRLLSLYPSIYRGKGGGGGALGFPLGGPAATTDGVAPRENPRVTCPPSQVEAALGGRPTPSGDRGMG